MSDYKTTTAELTAVANAIRAKGGTSAQLEYPDGYVSAVKGIRGGAWIRPSDWPDLDAIDMTNEDAIYLTYDLRLTDDYHTLSVALNGSSGNNYKFERGHLANNAFVADYSQDSTSETTRIDLAATDGNVQLWRITANSGAITKFSLQNMLYGGNSSNGLQPLGEVRIKCNSFVGTFGNRPMCSRYMQSLRLSSGTNYSFDYGCTNAYNLHRLKLEGTGKITAISFAFNAVQDPYAIDLSDWDLSACTGARNPFGDGMFDKLDFSDTGLDTQESTAQHYFLYAFPRIRELNLSNVDFGVNMVPNLSGTTEFYPGTIYESNISLSSAYMLSHASLVRIIAALPTATGTVTLALGPANYYKLTAEEIAVATAKGWTVTAS